MLQHRLTPPRGCVPYTPAPGGAFLVNIKLKAKVGCSNSSMTCTIITAFQSTMAIPQRITL
jgi:hypothetical protein